MVHLRTMLLGPALLAAVAAGPALAQLADRPGGLGPAWVARQVRSVEAMRATDPAAAARQATALRSQLLRGVATTGRPGGDAIVQRRMDEVVLRQPLSEPAGSGPSRRTTVQRPAAVPMSADDPLRVSPVATLVADLLDRAELALAEGRDTQARSDLAFATGQLGGTDDDAAGLELRLRADRLAQQLR